MTARAVHIVTLLCVYFFAWGPCAYADKRVALVIGNSEYGTQMRLLNPRNDAQDMADSLKSLGFEVFLRVDADKQSFTRALEDFTRAVAGADIGLFFYAGHGMQYYGSNYLMPVGAHLQDEVSVRFELIALDEIQRALDRSTGVRILILDACRNNPLAAELTRSMRASNRDASVPRGLARIEQARGTVVAYSTQANEIADDGAARNSPFTRALLENLREPGLEIGAMFRKVAARVYETTHGKQVPELSISLLSEVFLNRNETDAQVWARVRAANDPAGIRNFLDRFPSSFYAADARVRLDMLDREARDRQEIATIEQARREAEARIEALTRQTQTPTAAAGGNGTASPAATPPPRREPQRPQVAAINPDQPPPMNSAMNEGQLVVAIKTELSRLGCYFAPVDSNWQAPALRKAIADFATRTHRAKLPDGPAPEFLEDLKAHSGLVCVPDCGPRERESNGRCVAKTCAETELLDRDGNCVPRGQVKQGRPAVAGGAPQPHPTETSPTRRAGRGSCFNFNGRPYCE
jgi:uncharacterized caspase-like protein